MTNFRKKLQISYKEGEEWGIMSGLVTCSTTDLASATGFRPFNCALINPKTCRNLAFCQPLAHQAPYLGLSECELCTSRQGIAGLPRCGGAGPEGRRPRARPGASAHLSQPGLAPRPPADVKNPDHRAVRVRVGTAHSSARGRLGRVQHEAEAQRIFYPSNAYAERPRLIKEAEY